MPFPVLINMKHSRFSFVIVDFLTSSLEKDCSHSNQVTASVSKKLHAEKTSEKAVLLRP